MLDIGSVGEDYIDPFGNDGFEQESRQHEEKKAAEAKPPKQRKAVLNPLEAEIAAVEEKDAERTNIRQRQAEGIGAAKARVMRFGRSPKPLPENFHRTYRQWENGKITETAAKLCGIPLSSFRYRATMYEKAGLL